MSNNKEECELEHLVIPDEEQTPNDITPPLSTVPGSSHMSQTSNKTSSARSNEPPEMRSLSRNTTAHSALSSQSGNHQARVQHVNEKPSRPSERPPRPPPPTVRALNKRALTSSHVPPLQHHSFLSDVTDVRQMEQALLKLLEDFHSGKLRAFGKDCSMEQMTGIREQQEHLARLHFELGAQQELFAPLGDDSEDGLRQGTENMHYLMSKLEKLSISIEKLHSFSNSVQD
uniref:Coiled-coil domain-containing protein 28B n=1 Tax=Cacopsylla melanoneura TaxID=428564 RepID=A0A8D8S2L7_9HEMI